MTGRTKDTIWVCLYKDSRSRRVPAKCENTFPVFRQWNDLEKLDIAADAIKTDHFRDGCTSGRRDSRWRFPAVAEDRATGNRNWGLIAPINFIRV